MALLPKVKLKVLPTFPSDIIGGHGIEASKANGHVTVDLAFQEFAVQGFIPTSPTNNVLTYDTATDQYVMVPSSLLGGAASGIADAPVDGTMYGRNSSTWARAVAVGGDTMTGPLVVNGGTISATRSDSLALLIRGKEHVPSLVLGDAYSVFMSANGAYACWSFGGIPAGPFDGWLQVSNSSGTILDMSLQPLGGNVKMGGALSVVGNITALTPSPNDNSTKVATTAYVDRAARERLTAIRNYYVRPDGNDSNNGLSNIPGGAFLTIQHAVDVAAALDMSVYSVTINVGAGIYTSPTVLKSYLGAGPLTIRGDTTTPSNVVLTVTGNWPFLGDGVIGKYVIYGVKVSTPTFGACFRMTNKTMINIGWIEFGQSTGAHMEVGYGGLIVVDGPNRIVGGASSHYLVTGGGTIIDQNKTHFSSGTLTFGIFAYADTIGILTVSANTYGSATFSGQRYYSAGNSVVFTNGGGANYFPGNSAGSGTNAGVAPYGLYQ